MSVINLRNIPDHDTYIFLCSNVRVDRKACANQPIDELFQHLRQLIAQHKVEFRVKVKAHTSGCLGYCALGPNLVIFPDNVWYTYQTEADIEEIFNQHILQGNIVPHLLNRPLA